jgi:hypothetical protein
LKRRRIADKVVNKELDAPARKSGQVQGKKVAETMTEPDCRENLKLFAVVMCEPTYQDRRRSYWKFDKL